MSSTLSPHGRSPLRVHVVTHTHWDREWYHPLGRFRQRLVELVDELLDDPPAEGESFLLDGQGIVLEDYLAVRPERRAELSALLRDGRLEAGPWYVLADELIPGGEALVRNLLAGRRTLRALRAASPPVLYCPDSFGHPAMLPAIARGFGLEAIILWRGYGGARWPEGDAAWWDAPDGSRALLFHLPPDGYEFGSSLPADAAGATSRWAHIRAVLGPRAALGVTILQNGADHHARQLSHQAALAALGQAARPDVVEASSLGAFVRDALARASEIPLAEVHGELRDSYGYTWTLQGTFGARAHQKRANARVERLLVREAEPWSALSRARTGRSRRPLVAAAWRAVLECHPHDTLCGCAIDAVARAADVRWEDATAQGEGVRDDALLDLIGHDPAAARTRKSEWMPIVHVRNASARPRTGVARITVDTFVADVGVGPGSAGQSVVVPRTLPPTGLPDGVQVLSEAVVHARTESPRDYPDDDLVVRREVLVPVAMVPAYGIHAIPLDGSAPLAEMEPVASGDDTIGNAALAVRVDASGIVSVRSHEGRVLHDAIGIECRRDAGDLYTASIREDLGAPAFIGMRTPDAGPWQAALATDWTTPAPPSGHASPLTVALSVRSGEEFVRILVDGEHRGADQRIRLLVRTGIANPRVWADAAFGAVERAPIVVDPADAEREVPPPTAPLHRYVSLFGEAGGATLYSDGLAEYEVMPDGTIAVTLVRAVGELSRQDLPERPGNAGWPAPVPDAQSRGPFAAELALLLHGPTRDAAAIDMIERTADDVLLPLTGETLRSALAVPPDVAGVALEGAGLAFSALKESEDGQWIVVRCVNLTDETVGGRWQFGWPVTEARRARLDETPLDALQVAPGSPAHGLASTLTFSAPPREIVTVLVR